MKISLNLLKEYIDLNGIPAEEIAEKLTVSGLEIEEVDNKAETYKNFVVGFVKEHKKHPNADKLSVCTVSTDTDEFNAVCGAPNVAKGQKIAFAKIGAIIPEGGFKISKTKIRGEVSEGMICSEKELGLSQDHSGILVLDENLETGKPLADVLGLNDVIFEVSITPNRPDALSHIGVARDLAAIYNKLLKIPQIKISEEQETIEDFASVEIQNKNACPRYTARVITNVEVKDSPEWLKSKLRAIGLRPINNIVDITNFVLHEIGQPLHAFDLDKLSGNKIIVKNAKEGELFVTLDSKKRELKANDLMICDAEKPVAIAGIMGGENSEVSYETKNILLESAYFNPTFIRKTAKRLVLSTDASYRFERGTDPNITVWAADRAARLIAELANGKIIKNTIDVYDNKIEPIEVEIRFSRISKILGYEIPDENVKNILQKLGMKIIEENSESLKVEVPTFRPDIEREIDLIEEVARIYGYDKIPTVERIAVTLNEKNDESEFVNNVRNILTSLGFYETVSTSLQPKEIASITGNEIEVLNPQNLEMAALRTSLLPGALQSILKNINVGEKNLKLFEIGHVFNKKSSDIKSFEDFTEKENLILTVTGKSGQNFWYEKERQIDFYDLKGAVNTFLEKIQLDNKLNDSYNGIQNKLYDYTFEKTFDNKIIGFGGALSKTFLKKFDIDQEVFVFEFDLDELKKVKTGNKYFNELLKFPKVVRDCAFIVQKDVNAEEIIEALYKSGTKLLKNIKVFDLFESTSLGANKKSLAFSLEYFDKERTLTDDEVEKAFNNSIKNVVSTLNAELRGA